MMAHSSNAGAESARPLLGLLSRVRDRRWALGLAAVLGIAEHGLGVVSAGALGWIVGRALSHESLDPGGVVLAASVAGSAICAWQNTHFAHLFAYRHQAALRLTLFDGLERCAPRHLLGQRTGELGATAMGDVDALEMFFAHLALGAVVAIAVGTGAVIYLGTVHPALAAVAAIGMLLASLIPGRAAARAKPAGDALRGELGALNADVVDGIQGLRELVLFQRTKSFAERLGDRTRSYVGQQRKLASIVGFQHAATDALASLTTLGTLLVAVALASQKVIPFALATMAVAVVGAALGSVLEAIAIAGGLAPLRASARRVLTVLDQPSPVPDTGRSNLGEALPDVRFEDVRFGYEPGAEVLRGVSFEARAGETVALVGSSGAGKSTCSNLLLRFWDVGAGRVSIGGRDIRTIPLASLRRRIAVIPQDVYLFHGTIRDNLRIGNPDATDQELEKALRAANLTELMARLPDGLDTDVGERGALLSGGQRQRLAIARALAMDAPVLVMDEAASNLDAENERAIQSALRAARKGRTTLVIAHRLATIRAADRIVVLKDGRIVEQGTHEALLRAGGAYAGLVASMDEEA
ncbi:ABC transporter ATP-binding protein [Pendulispora albinea]|uniref:ABC transporter ATP-binding protein/permease n=1 Tax=Pendulispora albinea TaxID=2741071 RepID=A0ABZ2MBY0_9BACT